MRSLTRRPTFSRLALAFRRFRRDADAVRRIVGRNASKELFRALAYLNRVALKSNVQPGSSDLVWTDCGEQEVVNLARPACNRELPEVIAKRIGRYTLTNCFLRVNHRVMLIPPGPVPFEDGNKLLAYALKPEHYLNPFVHVPLTALLRSLGGRAARAPTLQKACLLTNAWNRTYHHWVAELLPQIVILEKAGIACGSNGMKFIIPTSPTRWQLESLESTGIPPAALVRVNEPTRVEELFVPSFPRREIVGGGWSILSPRILTQLRDRIYSRCNVDTSSPPAQKVYISRKLALGRQVINEEELEQALTRLGFRILMPETLSFAEEVRAFADARIVVGPSGSGLSNVIFCRGQVKVVEISAHEKSCEYPDSTDYSLTAGLGYEFSVYLAKPVRRLAPARFDLEVDVGDFCRFLAQATV